MKPQDIPQPFPEHADVPLRVRFYPLWMWFFVGTMLFAQTFIATRLWGGWNARALVHLVAIQLIFLPRVILLAIAISLGLTLMSSRLVRWIARPMSRKWLNPTRLIPAEPEIPLFLRTGESPIASIPGRRKTDQLWEPGWLVLTDNRLLWISGIWRTICWEIDPYDPEHPLTERVRVDRSPRWFGGYVVGMPPHLIADLGETREDSPTSETLAIAGPDEFMRFLTAAIEGEELPGEPESMEPLAQPPADDTQAQPTDDVPRNDSKIRRNVTGRIQLPPLRDYSKRRVKRPPPPVSQPASDQPAAPEIVRNIVLPPRRRYR